MENKIINRILKEANIPNLLDVLVNLDSPDLQSLLLEVYKEKTKKITPKFVLEQYKQSRYVKKANVDTQKTLEFDRLAFSLLPKDFEVIELSPIAPLGASSSMGFVDQNNILSTIRNNEVSSDPTNVLALESVLQREQFKNDPKLKNKKIKFCASQRVIRCQVFKNIPHAFAHFRLFALTTSGRDVGSFIFELESLTEHIAYFISLFNQLSKIDLKMSNLHVFLFVFDKTKTEFIKNLINELSTKYPKVTFKIDENKKSNYYQTAGYQIHAENNKKEMIFLIDGGFTNWTQKLSSNNKERFLISGLGSERMLYCFK